MGAALATLAEPQLGQADTARLAQVRQARAAAAAAYFKANAPEWERIRALHAPEKDVEAAIVKRMTARPIQNLLDAGTGTGRMLELLAPHARRAVGVDVSPEMLAIARDRLLRENVKHAQVRLADTYRLPFDGDTTRFDAVLFHQVLHYLDDPGAAVAEAARVMAPGGRLLIADFAPHAAGIPARRLRPSPLGLLRPRSGRLVRRRGPQDRSTARPSRRDGVRRKTHRQALVRRRQKRAQGVKEAA